MSYMVIRKKHLMRDSWRYGNWTQYIAVLTPEEDEAVICRPADWPYFAFVFGVALVTITGMGVWMAWQGVPVVWERMFWTALLGFLLMGPGAVIALTDWRLMVTLSDVIHRDTDGFFTRPPL